MGEGETTIHNKTALGLSEKPIGAVASLVEVDKGRGIGHEKGAKT